MFTVEEIARNINVKIFHNTALRVGDHIYGSSGDQLMAHNIRSGAILWSEAGFPQANLLMVGDGRAIWLDEEGRLGLGRLSPESFEVQAQSQILKKPAWTVPTLAGSHLYLRDQSRILALDLAAPPEAGAVGARRVLSPAV